jgi:hypothetical protein
MRDESLLIGFSGVLSEIIERDVKKGMRRERIANRFREKGRFKGPGRSSEHER